MDSQMKKRARQYIVRIKKQLKDTRQDKSYDSIQILEVHPDFESATFAIIGPIDSPYEGYWFRIFVEWPYNYPWAAPKFTFLDKIWNPYVHQQNGKLCMDLLRDVSPALTTQKYLLSIASLIGENKVKGNHSGFLNPTAASQMMTNYHYYRQQAAKMCERHAYKKNNIYEHIKRGEPQKHEIKATGKKFEEIVAKQSKDPKMKKPRKMIQKRLRLQRR